MDGPADSARQVGLTTLWKELGCTIEVEKSSGKEKGYPKSYQTFRADFKELLFISIALKLLKDPGAF